MTNDEKLMQQALDALEWNLPVIEDYGDKEQLNTQHKAITALRARLAQRESNAIEAPVQINDEYVRNYLWEHNLVAIDEGDLKKLMQPKKLLTVPALMEQAGWVRKREWQGLTDEEILEEYRQSYGDDGNLTDVYFARAIEAKLKEKNAT